ncbi:MAG TPA: prepilin-type N-terminal cleavage/methylation domain-containing protein [Burkholderiales bacterium]|nr:prepilin-type N-terminal cleavage/methylation domain-containing protein [Burkholderiales bacterium]
MSKLQKGFTLVEIAIVMVIIGLLLGGILKGQEMITQAKIKNALADFSGISAAYYGYQDRYRQLPGDDPNAGVRWAGAANGNGNGVVEGTYNQTCPATVTANSSAVPGTTPVPLESCMWWDDLRRAGFVAGSGGQQPFNAFSGLVGVQTGNGAGAVVLAPSSTPTAGFAGLIVCSANIPDKVAIALDTQMDDGHIASGTVRGELQSQPNPPITPTASTTDYQETGTNTYTLCTQI